MIKKNVLVIMFLLCVSIVAAQKPVQVLNFNNGEYLISTNPLGTFKTGGLYVCSVGLSCIADSLNSTNHYLYVYGRVELKGELAVTLKNGFTMTLTPSFSTHDRSRLGLIKKVDIYSTFYAISESELRFMCEVGIAEMKIRRGDTWLTKIWEKDDMTCWLKSSYELITKRIAKLRETNHINKLKSTSGMIAFASHLI